MDKERYNVNVICRLVVKLVQALTKTDSESVVQTHLRKNSMRSDIEMKSDLSCRVPLTWTGLNDVVLF